MSSRTLSIHDMVREYVSILKGYKYLGQGWQPARPDRQAVPNAQALRHPRPASHPLRQVCQPPQSPGGPHQEPELQGEGRLQEGWKEGKAGPFPRGCGAAKLHCLRSALESLMAASSVVLCPSLWCSRGDRRCLFTILACSTCCSSPQAAPVFKL